MELITLDRRTDADTVELLMQDSARETVPWGPSIACSTPAAIEWVAQWKASNDPSGRLISSHNDSTSDNHANGNGVAVANGKVNGAAEVGVAVAV
jgi:asparagine synthase (glutamine-hydrolysing)